jgi:Rieske [2Fe-2S] domain
MPIVRFDARTSNFVFADDTTYFLLETADGRQALVTGKCPHRSGPLHLACPDSAHRKLICPWHEGAIAIHWLIATAVPIVSVDHWITALLPVPETAVIQLAYRSTKQRRPEPDCGGSESQAVSGRVRSSIFPRDVPL